MRPQWVDTQVEDPQAESGEESQLSQIPEELTSTERLQLSSAEMDRGCQPSILSGMGQAQPYTLHEVSANPGPPEGGDSATSEP